MSGGVDELDCGRLRCGHVQLDRRERVCVMCCGSVRQHDGDGERAVYGSVCCGSLLSTGLVDGYVGSMRRGSVQLEWVVGMQQLQRRIRVSVAGVDKQSAGGLRRGLVQLERVECVHELQRGVRMSGER